MHAGDFQRRLLLFFSLIYLIRKLGLITTGKILGRLWTPKASKV